MTKTLREEIKKLIAKLNVTSTPGEFKDKVDWCCISIRQHLSEEFIREFKDKVNWDHISQYQHLSEEFIREFKDKVDWCCISICQHLSEEFIREFKDKVDWYYISKYQHLSGEFIREFKDKVDWCCISEEFIREFKDEVNWDYISKYQHLSGEFIREFKDKVNWYCISKFQYLSGEFQKEFNLSIPENNWLYTSIKDKLKYIIDYTEYEVIDDQYIIAYKSVRSNYYSVYTFQYKYEVGKTYTSHCDCNLDNENSFGLSAWTKEGAIKYYPDGKLLKVKIPISKVGVIIRSKQKIRCFEFEVIEEVN